MKVMKQQKLVQNLVETNYLDGKPIRRIISGDKTWFIASDIVDALADDVKFTAQRIWSDLTTAMGKRRFADLLLKMPLDGEVHEVVDHVGAFRLVQAIPTKKAEKLKRAIAEITFERALDEINPERAINRAVDAFRRQGRTDQWIDARLRSIRVRRVFTDEMQQRGTTTTEYGILTDVIYGETFGKTCQEYKAYKNLPAKRHELRDHMSETELILTMLAEQSATEIAKKRDTQGLEQNIGACRSGGAIAANARRSLEEQLGTSVVSQQNFLAPELHGQ